MTMPKVYKFFESVFNFPQYFIFQSVMTILLMDGLLILTVTVTLKQKNCAVNGALIIGMDLNRAMQLVPLALLLMEKDVLGLILETVGLLELLRLT